MDKTRIDLIKDITKKLKNNWGYSNHQIEVYWHQNKDLTDEKLKKELNEM